MQNKIIIYGKNGQMAAALAQQLQDKAAIFSHQDHDFSKLENIKQALHNINATAIINATAYTDVNKAEIEKDAAFKANALIPAALAQYCREHNIILIHYSTDYVFGDTKTSPYQETDSTSPLNVYGHSKLAGEEKIQQIGGKYLIFRTSWVFDHCRKNFLTTMLKLGKEQENLRIINDQVGAPTYAPHLAAASLEILTKTLQTPNIQSGIYHLCNHGQTNWHEFATKIFAHATKHTPLAIKTITPIKTEDYPSPAIRPHNSKLDCNKAARIFGITMPSWQDGLTSAISMKFLGTPKNSPCFSDFLKQN